MKHWTTDKQYTDLFHAQANNESEYIQLVKELFAEHKISSMFAGQTFENTKHLFNDDRGLWYDFFETDFVSEEETELPDGSVEWVEHELPDPKEFIGNIGRKPEVSEYPIALCFEFVNDDRFLFWYSYQ